MTNKKAPEEKKAEDELSELEKIQQSLKNRKSAYQKPIYPKDLGISEDTQTLVNKMLEVDPMLRISIDKIQSTLSTYSKYPKSPATNANKYDGFGKGSCHFVKWRPFPTFFESVKLPFDNSTG